MTQFYRSCVVLAVLLASTLSWAQSSALIDNIKEEKRMSRWSQAILLSDFSRGIEPSDLVRLQCVSETCTTDFDAFLSALTDALDSGVISKAQLKRWMVWAGGQELAIEERAQLAWTFSREIPSFWAEARKELLSAQSFAADESGRLEQMMTYAKSEDQEGSVRGLMAPVPIDANRIQLARDLLNQNVRMDLYANGEYAKALRIFMFCRDDRHYTCLMVMKNAAGAFVKVNGQYWAHKSLGYARTGRTYDQSNGNTPAGVLQIDGVMPSADKQLFFGKYRRMVLNLVPRSTNEEKLKLLLPASNHTANWWKESTIARNMGRGAFRIHGTKREANRDEPHFPFLGTAGCIAQRENTYDGVTYKDQRNLLDDLMKTLGLAPVYANEPKIKAILYVMNIDDVKKSVELSDLLALKLLP